MSKANVQPREDLGRLSDVKVLIVDDEREVLEAFEAAFSDEDFNDFDNDITEAA